MAIPVLNSKSKIRALWSLVWILWSASKSAGRELVWDSLRGNLLRLDGFSRLLHALVLLGFGAVAGMTGLLLTNDLLRTSFPLVLMRHVESGRGVFTPSILAPISLFVFSLAWSFLLVGAMHSHPVLRWGVFLGFLSVALAWGIAGISAGTSSLAGAEDDLGGLLGTLWEFFLAFLPLLLTAIILALYLVRSFFRARPYAEFLVIFILMALLMGVAQASAIRADQISGLLLGRQLLTANLMLVSSLVSPLLWLVGVDMALFALQVAAWGGRTAQKGLTPWILYGLLVVSLALRLWSAGQGFVLALSQDGWLRTVAGYLGALVLTLVGWIAWKIAFKGQPKDEGSGDGFDRAATLGETVRRYAFPLILLLLLPGLLTTMVNAATTAMLGLGSLASLLFPPIYDWILSSGNISLAISDVLNAAIFPWRFVFGLLCLAGGIWLMRRNSRLQAAYILALGGHLTWIMLTEVGWPLGFLNWAGPIAVDLWLVVSAAGLAIWSAIKKRMTPTRASGLLFLVFIGGLRQQTDFISNPFNPLLASAGIGLVAFGMVWDALNIGFWANRDTPALPRQSRLFLYLGYILLTVTLINWAVTTHDQPQLSILSGVSALRGFQAFGAPLIYLLFPLIYEKT